VKTIGALIDKYGDLHLALSCCQQPKKQSQSDGGSWQKLAAARRWITHCAGTVWHKGLSHEGPVVKERWQKGSECNNGIRNRGLGSKKIFYEALGQTTGLVIAKRIARSSIGIQKTGVKTLWRSWSPPKQKKRRLAASEPRCRSTDHSLNFCLHWLEKDYDVDTRGPTGTLWGSCSRWAALRWEKQEQLESNHCENWATRRKARPIIDAE
jgi:hypothetical protein